MTQGITLATGETLPTLVRSTDRIPVQVATWWAVRRRHGGPLFRHRGRRLGHRPDPYPGRRPFCLCAREILSAWRAPVKANLLILRCGRYAAIRDYHAYICFPTLYVVLVNIGVLAVS